MYYPFTHFTVIIRDIALAIMYDMSIAIMLWFLKSTMCMFYSYVFIVFVAICVRSNLCCVYVFVCVCVEVSHSAFVSVCVSLCVCVYVGGCISQCLCVYVCPYSIVCLSIISKTMNYSHTICIDKRLDRKRLDRKHL